MAISANGLPGVEDDGTRIAKARFCMAELLAEQHGIEIHGPLPEGRWLVINPHNTH
jgi:hypothetical protein